MKRVARRHRLLQGNRWRLGRAQPLASPLFGLTDARLNPPQLRAHVVAVAKLSEFVGGLCLCALENVPLTVRFAFLIDQAALLAVAEAGDCRRRSGLGVPVGVEAEFARLRDEPEAHAKG